MDGRKTKPFLLLLWFAFLTRGFWYCAAMPVWEGYDEPYHFAYLQYLAAGKAVPVGTPPVSLEVQHSLHLLPLAWELHLQHLPQPLISYDSFWRLSAAERDILISGAYKNSPTDADQLGTEWIPNYEFQQMPLYYWIFSVPTRWMRMASLSSSVIVLRFLGVLLASMVVPLGYVVARQVFRDRHKALGVAALLVLLPELMIDVSRVSNESLAIVLMSIASVHLLRIAELPESWIAWIVLSLALGFGLLTKAYFLVMPPALVLIVSYVIWNLPPGRERRVRTVHVLSRLCVALGIIFAVAGRWYWHIRISTGSWSGQGDDAALHHVSLVRKLAAVPHVDWKSGAISVLLSHIWFGGWSFLRFPARWYVLLAVPIAIAVAGLFVRLFRSNVRHAHESSRRQIILLGIFYLCFWIGLAYSVLIIFMSLGVSASTGWYLYCLIVVEIVLLLWGLEAFFPAKVVLPLLCGGVALMDLYGMHALMLPYYVGLTSHVGREVPSALMVTFSRLPTVFTRLAVNKPAWLSPPILFLLWMLYIGMTVGTVVFSAVVMRSSRSSADSGILGSNPSSS